MLTCMMEPLSEDNCQVRRHQPTRFVQDFAVKGVTLKWIGAGGAGLQQFTAIQR